MPRARIEKLLTETIGLDPASVGESTIHRSIQSRMTACGIARFDDYFDRLQHSAGEMQQLIEEVVIPETWFFRDTDTFTVLADWARGRTQIFRLLSFGCCTGEEPYSIAMCLLDAGIPADHFTIDATDISIRALNHAREGLYRPKAFRTKDLNFRDLYFRSNPESYQLIDLVRNRVKFIEGNILDSKLPDGGNKYHVIFCRNVLIYFDPPAQERAILNLQQLLLPDGILFAGPAESFLISQKGFTASGKTRGFVREVSKERFTAAKPARVFKETKKPISVRTPRAAISWDDTKTTTDLNHAAQLANSGKLREAAEICRFYLIETGPSAQAYYLLGLVLDATDEKREAAEHYRKALYLEPDHIEALTQLALLTENMGDERAGKRLRDRIRRTEARARR